MSRSYTSSPPMRLHGVQRNSFAFFALLNNDPWKSTVWIVISASLLGVRRGLIMSRVTFRSGGSTILTAAATLRRMSSK
jgi:hypothetical protein